MPNPLTNENYKTELSTSNPDLVEVVEGILSIDPTNKLVIGKTVDKLGKPEDLALNWLNQTADDRYDLDEKTNPTIPNIPGNKTIAKTLTLMARNLEDCVDGKLSGSMCTKAIKDLQSTSLENLAVPVKVAVHVLKKLGFKVYTVDQHYLHGQQGNRFEIVDEWAKRVSTDVTDFNDKKKYDKLRVLLETYVHVANLHPDKWEDSYESVTAAKPFNPKVLSSITRPIVPRTSGSKVGVTFERMASDIESRKETLAYLLPLVWAQGEVMSGGGFVSDDSYTGEIDRMAASGNVFQTAETLGKYLDYYLTALKSNGVTIDDKEVNDLKKLCDDLARREKSLVQVVSLLEKVLALNKFYGKNFKNKKKVTDQADLHKIIMTNKKIFEKVNNTRSKLMSGIRILIKYL